MPFVDAFLDLMPDDVVWTPLSGRDDYGKPTFGSPVEFAARLVREHKLVRNAAGETVVSTAHVWIGGVPEIGPEDRVTLADGTHPPIVSVERFPDETGPSHTKVYL